MSEPIAAANATFCATLFDEWIARGLSAAFIAPGSRSTPLALAVAARSEVRTEVFHDERSASFAALGHGLITGRPAALMCTSGTAAAHFHAAVIEANLSAVPLLVCTADRPPELWGRGAPQTIDQTELYGTSVRAFIEPGPPDGSDPSTWRPLAAAAWGAAAAVAGSTGAVTPGPVHLNLSFREPLTGVSGPLPDPIPLTDGDTTSRPDPKLVSGLAARMRRRRGVIIAGRGESDPSDVRRLAGALGWPIIADHRSGCRAATDDLGPISIDPVIDHADALLRHEPFASTHRPEVVLRLGEIMSSKAVSLWLRDLEADVLTGRPDGRHIDPEDIATVAFDEAGVAAALARALGSGEPASTEWLASWRAADDAAEQAIEALVSSGSGDDEIAIARRVLASVPGDGCLVVASSMPVRDIEWFGGSTSGRVVSNRGANGIDGTIATAVGIAATGVPTTVLIGDVAFLHDSTSLIALARRRIDLTIVVVDNDGGGIFSFLPQHSLLSSERYEQLFGTPHGTDLVALAHAHGLAAAPLTLATDLGPAGVKVFVAKGDRDDNLRAHDEAFAAVAAAIDRLG